MHTQQISKLYIISQTISLRVKKKVKINISVLLKNFKNIILIYSFVSVIKKIEKGVIMSGNIIGGASEVVALGAAQIHRVTALVGVKAELKKDEEMLDMLKKSQEDLQAITPTRGNSLNITA